METPKEYVLLNNVSTSIFFSGVIFCIFLIYSAALFSMYSFPIHNYKFKNINFFFYQICLFKNPQTQQFSTKLKEIQTKVIYRELQKHGNRRKTKTRTPYKRIKQVTKVNWSILLNLRVFSPQLLKQTDLQRNNHKILLRVLIASFSV